MINESEDREYPFEFERKFFVDELPADALEHGSKQVIVQAYLFAQDGYAVRVRLSFNGIDYTFDKFNPRVDLVGGYERRALAALLATGVDESTVKATIAVKSPSISGERYELENALDFDVAIQILQRSANLVLKNRYSIWYDQDGWEFDVFGGANHGLIVAECERLTPVTDLVIPEFCTTEVTSDLRFTNDYLSKEPFTQWDTVFRAELAALGPRWLNLKSPSAE